MFPQPQGGAVEEWQTSRTGVRLFQKLNRKTKHGLIKKSSSNLGFLYNSSDIFIFKRPKTKVLRHSKNATVLEIWLDQGIYTGEKIFSFYFLLEFVFLYAELKEWEWSSKWSQEAVVEIFLKEKALSSSLTRFFKSHEWVVNCIKTPSLRTRSSDQWSVSKHLSISASASESAQASLGLKTRCRTHKTILAPGLPGWRRALGWCFGKMETGGSFSKIKKRYTWPPCNNFNHYLWKHQNCVFARCSCGKICFEKFLCLKEWCFVFQCLFVSSGLISFKIFQVSW